MVINIENRWVRPALLKAFRAACILRYHIYEDTAKFRRGAQARRLPPWFDVPLPSINEVPIYSPYGTARSSPSTVRFQISADAYQGKKRHSNRFMYRAEADEDGFTRKVLSLLRRARLCTAIVRSWCPS